MIPFGEWLPDSTDLQNPGVTVAKNVLPHAQGYLPFPGESAYSAALTAYCRGAIYARDKSNNVYIYAGDATKIKKLTNDTWTDVTNTGADYTTGDGERWEFVKFNEQVIGVNFTDAPQAITMGGANFANLGGSPPKARHIATVRNFVVLGNVNDTGGDGLVPTRVHWSGLNNTATWAVSQVTQADYEDLPGRGGWVQGIAGGEYGIIFQENSIWRMSYVGIPVIFQLDEIASNEGLIAPGGFAQRGEDVYFLGQRGFSVVRSGSAVQPIGANKVDRFVLDDLDTEYLDRVSCVVDNQARRVYWAYPGSGNTGGVANKMVIYDYSTGRWSYSEQDTEVLLVGATSGYTLETLDNVSTDIDALTLSLDDPAWTGGTSQLAKFDINHKLAFYSGTNMSAVIETSELEVTPNRRTLITAVRPLVDGGSTTVQIGARNVQSGTEAWTPAATPNSNGRANVRKNARYHRIRTNITGDWRTAQGVDIEGAPVGWR